MTTAKFQEPYSCPFLKKEKIAQKGTTKRLTNGQTTILNVVVSIFFPLH